LVKGSNSTAVGTAPLFKVLKPYVMLLLSGSGGDGEEHWGDPGVDERIILRWIFKKKDVGVWTGFSWLRIQTGGGHL
jgi:hypothetical protein